MRKNVVKGIGCLAISVPIFVSGLGDFFSAVQAEQIVRQKVYERSNMDNSSIRYNESLIKGFRENLPSQFWSAIQMGFSGAIGLAGYFFLKSGESGKMEMTTSQTRNRLEDYLGN